MNIHQNTLNIPTTLKTTLGFAQANAQLYHKPR